MKSKFDWKEFEKKAVVAKQIKLKFGILKDELYNRKNSPFNNGTNEYSGEFETFLNSKIKNILIQYHDLPIKEKKLLKNKFKYSLKKDLDLIFNKKARCLIFFDSVAIYKFFQALSTIFDEIKIEINQDKLYICELDKSRKVLIEIKISNESYTFFKKGKISLDMNSLNKILKAKTSDRPKTCMILGKEKLFIEIISEKFKSNIKRVLSYNNQEETVEIPINELKKVKYPCRFQLTKEKLNYLISNSGLYSDKIEIKCNRSQIKFVEKWKNGNNEILWEKKKDNEIIFNFSILKTELEQLKKIIKTNPDSDLQNQLIQLQNYIRKITEKPEIKGKFLRNFLVINLKMMNFLKESDLIIFSLRDEKPLKSEIKIERLGNALITFYLAPSQHK